MSTAHDLPLQPYGDELAPALRLVPQLPLDFDESVRRVRPRLHRYAIRRLGDSHEAEELVQEALLRAYSHRELFQTEEDLSAWTTVVTGRLVIDRLRVRGRSTSVADVPEGTRLSRDTADVVVARDEARTALDALDAMPPRQASVLWAREVEGQSYEELCVRFGMSEPAVRSVLTRARKALRKEYALRGGTLPVGGLAVLAPWVAGLGWAGKLRASLGRLGAPAALATVGVTALGSLVVVPFGSTSTAPAVSTFRPAQAVVSLPVSTPLAAAETVLHGPVAPRTLTVPARPTATAPVNASGAFGGSLAGAPIPSVDDLCPTGTASSGTPGAGGKGCSQIDSTRSLYVDEPLPQPVADTLGYEYLNVETGEDVCSVLPSNPLLKCTDRTQP